MLSWSSGKGQRGGRCPHARADPDVRMRGGSSPTATAPSNRVACTAVRARLLRRSAGARPAARGHFHFRIPGLNEVYEAAMGRVRRRRGAQGRGRQRTCVSATCPRRTIPPATREKEKARPPPASSRCFRSFWRGWPTERWRARLLAGGLARLSHPASIRSRRRASGRGRRLRRSAGVD